MLRKFWNRLTDSRDLGMKVRVQYHPHCPYSEKEMTFRNVTEVHYKYPRFPDMVRTYKLALESDIHRTGRTEPLTWIAGFEIFPETEMASEF